MSEHSEKVAADRKILTSAQQKGGLAVAGAYVRLSGPGWLQSAITLGAGSLTSALYLGVLGGTSVLWVQLLAIAIGVIMLYAISYVTLSTGERPYQAINEHINPVLGVGWITATILANMIWIMPQFSLCFDVLDKNLGGSYIESSANGAVPWPEIIVTGVLFALATAMILLSTKPGLLTRLFDLFLKLMVAIIVVCFVGVVVYLVTQGQLSGNDFRGFVPDFSSWLSPKITDLINSLPADQQKDWTEKISVIQTNTMISAAATAVGINMTFLLPYSMLNRGWDKPFRGLARFDLITGMAIPYLLVTSCIVIASAYSFHAKADENLLSSDPAIVQESTFFKGVAAKGDGAAPLAIGEMSLAEIDKLPETTEAEKQAKADAKSARLEKLAHYVSTLAPEERELYVALVQPNTGQLSQALAPLLGDRNANLVFGIGALGMGFSSVVILMMINGFALREMLGKPDSQMVGIVGALLAGVIGLTWPWVWSGVSKTWMIILASTFGVMLLPIAYVTFFAMMNSRSLLGDNKPTGMRMVIWNVLMAIGVLAATLAAVSSIYQKTKEPHSEFVIGAAATFVLLAIIGFSARSWKKNGRESA